MDEENQTELTNQDDQAIDDQEVDQIDTGESNEDQSQDQEIQDDGTEEIEFNAQNYRLPKDIAEAVRGMQKDYTTKTQSLAEQRREFESQAQFQQENFKEVAQAAALDERLAEYNQIDWNSLIDNDPVLAQKLSLQRDALKAKAGELRNSLAQKYQNGKLERQLAEAKLIEQSEAEIKRVIKDWSPELDGKLQKFAVDRYGFPRDQVGEYKKDPKIAKLLHDAFIGQQIVQKQINKPKIVQDAKPVSTLSGNTSKSNKSIFDLEGDDFDKARARFIASKRNRK